MDDPAVTRAAIEALRKEMRGRTGGRIAGPPPTAGDVPEVSGEPGVDDTAAETPPQPGEEAKGSGDMTCPSCGAHFALNAAPENDGGEPPPGPAAGPGKADLLLMMPKPGRKK